MSTSLKSRVTASAGILILTAGIGVFLARPGHTAGGPIPVQVTGTAVVRDLDNAAQQPFATSTYFTARPDATDFLLTFTVPTGKCLVIQGVSMQLNNITATNHPVIAIHTSAGGTQTDQIMALPSLLDSFNGRADFVLPQQAVTFYADAGSQVSIEVAGVDSTSVTFGSVYGGIIGYLVNTP